MSGVCSSVYLPFLPQIVALPTEEGAFTMNEFDPRAIGTEKFFKTIQFHQLFSINKLDSHENCF